MKKTEQQNFHILLGKKKSGMTAFIARPCKGIGADRSVLLVCNNAMGWAQGLKCWNANHRERAEEYCKIYNCKECSK